MLNIDSKPQAISNNEAGKDRLLIIKGDNLALASDDPLAIKTVESDVIFVTRSDDDNATHKPSSTLVSETQAVVYPTMFVDRYDGHIVVRFETQHYKMTDPDYVFSNTVYESAPGQTQLFTFRNIEHSDVVISNVEMGDSKYGIKLYNNNISSIYKLTFDGFNNERDQYGAAIAMGTKSSVGENYNYGATYIQNVYMNGRIAPLKSYKESNRDFIMTEEQPAPIFVRDVTAKNVSDSFFDAKNATLYISNATLDSAHKAFRIWPGTKVIIVNSKVTVPLDEILVNFPKTSKDESSDFSLQYYNVSWNGSDTLNPDMVKYQYASDANIGNHIEKLDYNPLPEISDFFDYGVDAVQVEVSTDGGNFVVVDSNGLAGDGMPAQGDMRFELDLGNGDHIVRTRYFTLDGGEYVMDADGNIETITDDLSGSLPDSNAASDAPKDSALDKDGNRGLEDLNSGLPAPYMNPELISEPVRVFDWVINNTSNYALNSDNRVVYGDDSADKLTGTDLDDRIYGHDGDDRLKGKDGNDLLYGDNGRDALNGGKGEDTLRGGDGDDRLKGDDGDDHLYGDGGADEIDGGKGVDTLNGGGGDDKLKGGDGDDLLLGGDGDDYLEGENGDDIVIGGKGHDDLYGKDGADTFAFLSADDIDTWDEINDFDSREGDRIDISKLLQGYDPRTDAISDFLQVTNDDHDTFVSIDVDGGADHFVLILQLADVTLANERTLIVDGTFVV